MCNIYNYELRFHPIGCALEWYPIKDVKKLNNICKEALQRAEVDEQRFVDFNECPRKKFEKFHEEFNYEVDVSDKFDFNPDTFHSELTKVVEIKNDEEIYKFLYLFAMKIAQISRNMDSAIEINLTKKSFSLDKEIWKAVAKKIRFSVFFIRNIFHEKNIDIKEIPGLLASLEYFDIKYMKIITTTPTIKELKPYTVSSEKKGNLRIRKQKSYLKIETLKKNDGFKRVSKEAILQHRKCYVTGENSLSDQSSEIFLQPFPPQLELIDESDVDHFEPQSLLIDVLYDIAKAAELSKSWKKSLVERPAIRESKTPEKYLEIDKYWLQCLFASHNELVVMLQFYNRTIKSDWPFVVFYNIIKKKSIFHLLPEEKILERRFFFLEITNPKSESVEKESLLDLLYINASIAYKDSHNLKALHKQYRIVKEKLRIKEELKKNRELADKEYTPLTSIPKE